VANKQFSQKHNLIYNNIPGQTLTYANQLSIRAWNDIVNILRTQTNTTVDYLRKLHTWLIGDGEDILSYPDSNGFIKYVDTQHKNLKSEIDKNKQAIEQHYKRPIYLGEVNTITLDSSRKAAVNISGYGSKDVPLNFNFGVPKGKDGRGVHLFSIDANTGNLIVHASRQEDVDNYQIDPDTGELFIVLEV
jgi:hypothetical protein